MRIVPNLNEVYFCPNCNSPELYEVKDLKAIKGYKCCPRCHEEIREGNILDNAMRSIPHEIEKEPTIKMPKMITRGQETADTLRQEIGYLRSNIHDIHSMTLVNRLTDILNLIADYIEEH